MNRSLEMSASIDVHPIGSQGLKASSLGYGAMGLTQDCYGPPSDDDNAVGMNILPHLLQLIHVEFLLQ